MSDSQVIKYSVFDIDVDNDSCEQVDLSGINDQHLLGFILKMAHDTSSSESSRKAIFSSSSAAKECLEDLAINESTNKMTKIASRLLNTEKTYNKRIEQLNKKIRAGNLIIAKVKRPYDTVAIIAKIEFSNFLDRKSFLLSTGLPEEKSLLRSCVVPVVNDNLKEGIVLYGSNGVIPAYWHEGFLEAVFKRDNTINTDTSFKLIEAKMAYIKKESKDDYIDLRDCLIGYYKSNTHFQFEEVVELLTEKFQPENKSLDLGIFKSKLMTLKNQDKFDGSFEIDKKQVTARARRKYPLDGDVELIANSGTTNIFRASKNEREFVLIETQNIPDDFKPISF